MGVAAPSGDLPDIEKYLAVEIGVTHLHPGGGAFHLDAKFLVQFAFKRREHRLVWIAFTAGELPFATLMGIGRATRHEDLMAVKQQADRDVNRTARCGTRH